MRKTSYVLTFLATAVILLFNVLSVSSPSWVVVIYPQILRTKVTEYYGLMEKCELKIIHIPNPSGSGHLDYTSYSCHDFPQTEADLCDNENRRFCILWTSAGYVSQVAIGFIVITMATILFGLTTHSRRRRIWRAVAGLISLQTALQIICFGIVTDAYRMAEYPTFEQGRPGIGYILNTLSWVIGILTTGTVIIAGLAADRGHRWAAGNSAYHRIES